MTLYKWIFIFGFISFLFSTLYYILKIALKASFNDLSTPKGSLVLGILYSATGAMSPVKKESAYLHLPTYTAGIVYHLGSFLALFWLIIHFFDIQLPSIFSRASSIFLIISAATGFAILIKRITTSKLRLFSNPDDYFSNIIVTGFHLLSSAAILNSSVTPILFIYSGFMLFYIPLGKLRHIIFFVCSRLYLGIFYGKRGVWPPRGRFHEDKE